MRTSEAVLAEEVGSCFADPLRFVRLVFDWNQGELAGHAGPDAVQEEVLRAIGTNCLHARDAVRVAVASGHGIGKTALVAWIILWFMSTRVKCAGVITANTKNQLTTKTWRELGLWHRRAINAHWFSWSATKFAQIENPDTWFVSAIPWTTERSESFAGLHARDVLVIYDEASAIHDEIWEVSEGAMTTRGAMWVAVGNPTRNTGRFHDCFGRFRHRWITHQVDSRRSRFANQDQIAQWIEDYGEDSDFVRVRVRGVFPRAGSDQFIGEQDIDAARGRTGEGVGPKVLGVDVARFGDDQTVFLLRNGDRVEWIRRHRGLDLMQTAARVADIMVEVKPDAVFIDGVGVGGGVVDRLTQMGFRAGDVNSGGVAVDDARFANLRAEMWSRMRDWLKDRGAIPAEDIELATDLAGPHYLFDQRNRLRLERKQDMKARGLASPDAGDALALTFARTVAPASLRLERYTTSTPPDDPWVI